jgi:hypothetical protein
LEAELRVVVAFRREELGEAGVGAVGLSASLTVSHISSVGSA